MKTYQQINATTNTSGHPVFTEPAQNYNLYAPTESEKFAAILIIRGMGAIVTAVSGCGRGYYIQIDATPTQAAKINKKLMEATQ